MLPEKATKKDLAQLFGLTVKRIEQLVQDGIITGDGGNPAKYPLVDTVRGYTKYLSDKAYGRDKKNANADLEKEKLAAEGIDVEVIDPRTIAPLDKDTIFNSICKTHRAAVVEESNKTAGIGAELAAMFQEELYDELDGPVARIAALDVPMPYNIAMEHYSIPDVNRICASIRAMMD